LCTSAARGVNPITAHAACPWVYGAALILTGAGSAFYHASLTFVGQFFDLMGMYFLASFILVYNLARLQPLEPRVFVVFYLLLNFTLAYLLFEAPMLRRYLFGTLLLAALVLEHRLRRRRSMQINNGFLQIALSLLVVAFATWVLDITRALCRPESWLQGHAAWHLLGAAAAGFLYFYYRSENAGE
jgi:hypothetical protein